MRRGDVARGASQGVHVPQVHAFNVLRATFADKDLSTETTAFAARGLEVAVRAFSSPHWEVSGPKRRRTTIVSDRFATRDRFPTDSSFSLTLARVAFRFRFFGFGFGFGFPSRALSERRRTKRASDALVLKESLPAPVPPGRVSGGVGRAARFVLQRYRRGRRSDARTFLGRSSECPNEPGGATSASARRRGSGASPRRPVRTPPPRDRFQPFEGGSFIFRGDGFFLLSSSRASRKIYIERVPGVRRRSWRGPTLTLVSPLSFFFSSFVRHSFQVRNGATLAFAALLTKTCGYMNSTGGASRRAVTGDEFFARFPALHPFLLAQIADAAAALDRGVVHPSLFPTLAILGRLRHSGVNLRDNKTLDPAAFAPFLRRCAKGRPMALRAAAARALAPLVAPEKVAATVRATLGTLAQRRRRALVADEGRSRDDHRRPPPPPPTVGYNAAHGALLCVLRAFDQDGGPAVSGDAVSRAAAVVAVAGGLGGCAYLAMESPVAVVAEAWLACAEAAVRVADPGSPGQKILKRLAWGACDVAEGARRWGNKSRRREGPEPGPAQGGGGDDHSKEGDDGDDASSSFFFGASVAPGDVAWFKTAARLRVTLALTEGAESEEVEGRSTTTRASPSGPSGPSGARDSDSAADSASATAAVVASATAAVIACLDPTAAPYEARHAAMKALRDADASLVRSRLDVRALRRTLATRLLPRETGHGCARRALQLLAAWSPTESPSYVSDEDAESDLEVSSACWDAAAELASASANERVRCAALRCLGAEFGARKKRREKKGTPRRTQGADSTFESAFESFESFAAGASTLAALIVAGSRPERPEDVRRAAADALARSGLLDLETDEREVFFSEEAADSVSAGTTTTRAPSSSSFSSAPRRISPGRPLARVDARGVGVAFRLMEDEDRRRARRRLARARRARRRRRRGDLPPRVAPRGEPRVREVAAVRAVPVGDARRRAERIPPGGTRARTGGGGGGGGGVRVLRLELGDCAFDRGGGDGSAAVRPRGG